VVEGLADFADSIVSSIEPWDGVSNPETYVAEIIKDLRVMKKSLKKEGVVWLNIRDSYRYIEPVRDEGQAGREEFARGNGIEDKRIGGNISNRENDIMAAAAEKWACEALSRKFHGKVDGPDDGADCYFGGRVVDVKWVSHKTGHLLHPPHQPFKDIYVVVAGRKLEDFRFLGWATGAELSKAGVKDFGFGPCKAIHASELRSMDELLAVSGRVKPGELVMLPERVALAMQADGWFIKAMVVLTRNTVPGGSAGRPTRTHGVVIMASRSEEYYYSEDNPVGSCWTVRNRGDWVSRCIRLTTPPLGTVYDPYDSPVVQEEAKRLGCGYMKVEPLEGDCEQKEAKEEETPEGKETAGGAGK